MYCAPRQIERDGRLMNGIFLHVFLDEAPPAGSIVVLNYYQEHLITGGTAIPCDGSC